MLHQDTITFYSGSKNSPPLKCGCGVLNIVVRTPGILVGPGQVLEARIVRINEWDTPFKNSANQTQYQYDYIIEYDEALLIDPDVGIRGCDIEIACCESCTSKFTKGLLKGYVQGVTGGDGDIVDNTDPQNPVINLNFRESLLISAGVECRSVGPGNALVQFEFSEENPNILLVQSAPTGTHNINGAAASTGVLDQDISAAGEHLLASLDVNIDIVNINECLTANGPIILSAAAEIEFFDGGDIKFEFFIGEPLDPVVYTTGDRTIKAFTSDNSMTTYLQIREIQFLDEIIGGLLAFDTTKTIVAKFRLFNTGGSGARLKGASASLRSMVTALRV